MVHWSKKSGGEKHMQLQVNQQRNSCQAPELLPGQDSALKSNSGASGVLTRAERTGGDLAVSGVYRESQGEVKTLPGIPKTNSKPSDEAETTQYTCGSLIIFTECENGLHHFAKKILCGKEWCSECGEDGSQAHNRKIARWLPKFQQISQLGYIVVEFPDRYRKLPGYGYSKRGLRLASNIIVEVLAGKRMGRRGRVGGYFSRGLVRWHWFGEKKGGKWNPHANVLVDSGRIEPKQLEVIKVSLREALKCPDLIVHYSYAPTPGEIYHKLKYVTRATFRQYNWDPYMANQLYGFRNCRWWGSWKDEPAWELTKELEAEAEMIASRELTALGSGICPDCGAPLKKWARPVDSSYLVIWGAQEIGKTGYYRIPHKEWNGGELSPGARLRLEQLEQQARGKLSVAAYMVTPGRHAGLKNRIMNKRLARILKDKAMAENADNEAV